MVGLCNIIAKEQKVFCCNIFQIYKQVDIFVEDKQTLSYGTLGLNMELTVDSLVFQY